ncbi:phenolic glucoside malonyltransferase 1 [Vitis vinifera]|uniref:phenolic glucoside malonyltransferase 1 n=1 Tax=Vitis vinifera TaxID=29760 RepID=UPI00053F4D1B|nr:phenolic glucoside malonyltransferase 1 [Vitis vinifera]|eukprot:XP_010657386.1 PREDICTED: malonyl-coenzyme A:anthocyanin 3-O-glucoside-6''-O-malonyltransferase [Vitis vinifera]
MASSDEMVNVLEECRVSPPPNAVGEKSLPLTFFDLLWLHFHLVQSLFFYKFPHSKTHFIEITIPSLKHSLSLALKHFYPFAGNLLFPPNLREPEIHYVDGDSVSLTFVESNSDFDYLIKNHQRKIAHFHPLVPQLPPVSVQQGTIIAPVFAVQVTLFPNSGISFGFTCDHVVADGNAFIRFIRLWATIHKLQREPLMLEGEILPFYDRTMVKDPNKIGSIFWQHHQKSKFEGYRPLLPTSNILASFLLSQADLQRLKKRVMVQCPTLLHVSSFTVTCAYTWTCIVKAQVWSGEEVSENELEHFGFVADCRACLDPPLPENYFANLIGEAIQEKLGSKKGVLEGLDKWVVNFSSINIERAVGVAGSPRFSVYDIDFGLGQLQKREFISIDETRSISLLEGKDNKSDIEVGLSFPKIKMDAFASIFTNGLSVYD